MSLKELSTGPIKSLSKISFHIHFNRKLKKVISENEELKVQKERYRKRLQRINLQNTSVLSCSSVSTEETDESTSTSTEVLTPRCKTMGEIRTTGISPRNLPKPIKRKLIASNILSEEIKEATRQNKKKSSVLRNIVFGRLVKRYKNVSLISKMTGFDRKNIGEGCSKSMTIPPKKRSTNLRDVFADKADQFLCSDDNSRMLPGKKDGKGLIQRRALYDYMKNLHLKFMAEFPEIKLSAGTFSKLRPANVRLCNFLSKKTCLCSKYQNFALKCKCLQSLKVCNITNPDSFILRKDEAETNLLLNEIKEDKVTFNQWKRVKIKVGGKVKDKTRLVSVKVSAEEFKSIFREEMREFREHVDRVKIQYRPVKDVKEGLLPGPVMLQMDFAEDYRCQNADEVQNAYFSAGNVTIFPVAAYNRADASEELSVQSFAIISDEEGHDAGAVYEFLKNFYQLLEKLFLMFARCFTGLTFQPVSSEIKVFFRSSVPMKVNLNPRQTGTILKQGMARDFAMALGVLLRALRTMLLPKTKQLYSIRRIFSLGVRNSERK